MSERPTCYFCGKPIARVRPIGPKRIVTMTLRFSSGTEVIACVDCVRLDKPEIVEQFESDAARALRAEMRYVMR